MLTFLLQLASVIPVLDVSLLYVLLTLLGLLLFYDVIQVNKKCSPITEETFKLESKTPSHEA